MNTPAPTVPVPPAYYKPRAGWSGSWLEREKRAPIDFTRRTQSQEDERLNPHPQSRQSTKPEPRSASTRNKKAAAPHTTKPAEPPSSPSPKGRKTFMNKNTSPLTRTIRIIRLLNFQYEKRLRKIAATLPAHLQQRFLNDHGVEVNDVPAA